MRFDPALSITTFLTQDIAAVPFLWIVPLVVYLLSFILCFEAPRWYKRALYIPMVIVALCVMEIGFRRSGWHARMIPTICVYTASLFVCCMFCHGELASLKPHPRYLTSFYVMASLGGATGGLFVSLVAPNYFNANYEFPIGMALCAALVAIVVGRSRSAWLRVALRVVFYGYLVFLGMGIRERVHGYRALERNFYGMLHVAQEGGPSDEDGFRWLAHGRINHGGQMLNEKYRRMPVTYFCPASGIGRAMAAIERGGPRRVGVLGLGCGSLAAYGRVGDTYRLYEINPLVVRLANAEFSYLRDTPAKVEVVLGDGRLSLERESSQQFDLLVMDAFSGDSVPVHLLTREAFEIYYRHLKPGGVLAVNITNRYLDLRPVIERAASYLGKIARLYIYRPMEDDILCYYSDWALIMLPSMREWAPELLKAGEALTPNPRFRMWTDDFSNMWSILR